MQIVVTHVVNGSTKIHQFTCTDASRQLSAANGVNIVFRGGPGILDGLPVLTAQYRQAEVMITYQD